MLIAAAKSGQKEIVSLLLSAGANINEKDEVVGIHRQMAEIVTNEENLIVIQYGGTALLAAVSCGNAIIVSLLLSSGANISDQDKVIVTWNELIMIMID